jgi:hypothetical protein
VIFRLSSGTRPSGPLDVSASTHERIGEGEVAHFTESVAGYQALAREKQAGSRS